MIDCPLVVQGASVEILDMFVFAVNSAGKQVKANVVEVCVFSNLLWVCVPRQPP